MVMVKYQKILLFLLVFGRCGWSMEVKKNYRHIQDAIMGVLQDYRGEDVRYYPSGLLTADASYLRIVDNAVINSIQYGAVSSWKQVDGLVSEFVAYHEAKKVDVGYDLLTFLRLKEPAAFSEDEIALALQYAYVYMQEEQYWNIPIADKDLINIANRAEEHWHSCVLVRPVVDILYKAIIDNFGELFLDTMKHERLMVNLLAFVLKYVKNPSFLLLSKITGSGYSVEETFSLFVEKSRDLNFIARLLCLFGYGEGIKKKNQSLPIVSVKESTQENVDFFDGDNDMPECLFFVIDDTVKQSICIACARDIRVAFNKEGKFGCALCRREMPRDAFDFTRLARIKLFS